MGTPMAPLQYTTHNDSVVYFFVVDKREYFVSDPSCRICNSKNFELSFVVFIEECNWHSDDSVTSDDE